MIKIKSFTLDETNWLEVTWVDEVSTQVEVEKEVDGKTVVETETNIEEVIIWCESYSGHSEHIQMLRARGVEFNTSLDEYEDVISACIDAYVYPTEEELNKELIANQIQEALNYLAKTDHKDLPRYKPKDDEDMEEIYAKRDEAREFIRLNK